MQNIEAEVLVALYRAARESRPPGPKALSFRLGVGSPALASALRSLERRGFANASTARLTFPGLAVAAALSAERASSHRTTDRRKRTRRSLAA
ncbi:MAG TPA: hypothetical protein VHE30_20585 [Polyangiaceae bacterium]|nr:hypothetical protein [Polyangiaceae bacterium]